MTTKYFHYHGGYWQIIETKDPWGKPMTIAVEMDDEEGASLTTEKYINSTDWELVKDPNIVDIDGWFLYSDPEELFLPEEEMDVDPKYKPNLKEMLENLQPPSLDHWSMQWDDDDISRHERLKAGLYNPNKTVGRAADILGLIRDRQQGTIEMPPTVLLNENKYPDSGSLEQAIKDMRERHGDNAHIRIGKHTAEDMLATYKNQETIGLSSVMKFEPDSKIELESEVVEILSLLRAKK